MRTVETKQSSCYFGIACGDITPPVGIYHRMWGAAVHDRSEGVHRPLTATALSFKSLDDPNRQNQVLVALDHCLLGVEELDMILDRAAGAVPRGSITMTFSHTHAAGLLNLDRQEMPGGELIPPYLDKLADTVAELVEAAATNTSEADIVYGAGQCSLAAHRDYFDEQAGEHVCGFNPRQTADDTVVVARVTSKDGRTIAGIVNYACHPTTLAWDNRLISPDFPGALREVVENAIGAPCVFLQGASGELGPVNGFVGDPTVADRNGRQLGYAALSVWESLPPAGTSFQYTGQVVSGATIGTWQHVAVSGSRAAEFSAWTTDRDEVRLDYREGLRRRDEVEASYRELLSKEQAARDGSDLTAAADLRALAERERRALGRLKGMQRQDYFGLQTAMWRIGDAVWVTVQGEPYSLLQQALRQRFPENPLVIASIANGWGPSYLPPRQSYGTGVYQETIAWLAPGSLETLIDELGARIANTLAAR